MSLAVLKRKAFARAKIKNKKNIHSNCCYNSTQPSTDFKSSSYHNYLRRKATKCLCPDGTTPVVKTSRNIVRDRVNRRITASQHIENKRLASIQRVRCDKKKADNNNNNNNNNNNKKCGVPRNRVGYTRKESILRFCNTTKELNIVDSSTSYRDFYDAKKSDKAFRCEDLKNPQDPKCRVY